ncbi:MAG TPA: sigma-54 dependent transcriptional regulator [Longimicrobiaceae bacterium]|nr:sigma-54 dependent transcriptional regulator [Longimicrobiaceae bacterium]
MQPVLALLPRSDSFSDLWPRLAALSGTELRRVSAPADLAGVQGVCALVVAAGGEETRLQGLFAELREGAFPPTAVVGAETDYRVAVALLQMGAADYFALPDELGALRAWIVERAEVVTSRRNAQALAESQRRKYDFSRIAGRSPELQAALDRAARVIPSASATVLVTGETGTGKELLAQAIHYNGPRAAQPFVEINCAALPANLLEAELFGYERGAFTDARAPKAGLFEAASGGTLLLDEVGDLAPDLQAKLLSALENKRVRRLGSVRDTPVDVRIVAATHRDLAEEVRRGRFRRDLYYRLRVVPVHLPPLRERGDDVLLLMQHFLEHFSELHGKPCPTVPAEVRAALLRHTWPGNVRELRNAVERAVLLGDGTVRLEDLALEEEEVAPASGVLPFPAPLDAIERAAAVAMLRYCEGNKSQAAMRLGIGRKRLYQLLAGQPEGGMGG